MKEIGKSDESSSPKIGEGHASAMFRQGLRELRGALYPESNIAQPPDYGVFGNRSPGEQAAARRPEAVEFDQEGANSRGSILEEKMRQVEARESREPEKSLEMER